MDGFPPNEYNNHLQNAGPSDNQQINSYMNFEQFMSQYNSAPIYYNNYPTQQQFYQYQPYNGVEYSLGTVPSVNYVEPSSNLTAMAEEFIPRGHLPRGHLPPQQINQIDNQTVVNDNTMPSTSNYQLPYNQSKEPVQSVEPEKSKNLNIPRGENSAEVTDLPKISRSHSQNYNNSNNGTGAVRKNYKNDRHSGNNSYSNKSNRYNNNDYNYSEGNVRRSNRSHAKSNYYQDNYYDYNDNRRQNRNYTNNENHSSNRHRTEKDPGPIEKKGDISPLKNNTLNRKFEDLDISLNENNNSSQREKLIQEIESGRLECLVCCEKIRPTESVWSCSNCFHILHLKCTIKWGNSSKSEDGWRCPACQNINKNIPNTYYCFCGKQKNPQYNRNHDIAHSCGDVCNRNDFCEHICTLLCHPGPCPPCQASVTRTCGCGKTTKTLQCSLRENILCGNICNKLLKCNVHHCDEVCHSDECSTCAVKLEIICFCKKETKSIDCTEDNHKIFEFACSNICDKMLSCNNHKCEQLCHEGDCNVCPFAPAITTSCPCGKVPIARGERKSCIDPITACKNICGKQLTCGPIGSHHTCSSRCHPGICPPCNKKTTVKCRCGAMDQEMKCKSLKTRADDARCKKKCPRWRNCAKHKCNQECCIDIDHICPLTCSKTLSCGKNLIICKDYSI